MIICPYCQLALQPMTTEDGWISLDGMPSFKCSTFSHYFRYNSETNFILTITDNVYNYAILRKDNSATFSINSRYVSSVNKEKQQVTRIDPNFSYQQIKQLLDRYLKLQAFS